MMTTDEDSGDSPTSNLLNKRTLVVYKRRWFMLLIYFFNNVICAELSLSLNPINNIASHYYGVPSTSIEWLSNMGVLVLVVFGILVTYFINRFGVRPVLLSGAFCNLVGTSFNFFGHSRDKFYFLFTGQIFAGFALSCILP